MTIESIEQQFSDFEDVEFHGGVSDAEIDAAAARLGLPIEGGYREFLRRFGCGSIEDAEFIGLGGPDHLNVVSVTESQRKRRGPTPYPGTFIPLLADGYGNYDSIDTSRRNASGESPVVYWLHDAGDEELEELAPGFLEWLDRKLEELRELDEDEDDGEDDDD